MKLLIISHTAHYTQSGKIVGWEPTIQEINHLAHLFSEIRHIAWLHAGEPPPSVLHYSTDRISFLPVKPSGGSGLRNKLSILAAAPGYVHAIRNNLDWADMVHVRCPSSIALMAIVVLKFNRNPRFRWVKYATNWSPEGKEPWSFNFQRWWLRKNLHRGIVTVNGRWPEQPGHVHSFLNPCILDEEISRTGNQNGEKKLLAPFRFMHVGRIEEAKGLGRALDVLARLQRRNIPLRFDIVGDGERKRFEEKSHLLGLQEVVHFHGWLDRSDLNRLYQQAHFLLFPSSSSEGWPKVLSEAMNFGVVPLAGAVSSIPQILKECDTGIALSVKDPQKFVDAVINYIEHPELWRMESNNAILAAKNFTYGAYLTKLAETFQESWGIEPSMSKQA